MCHQFDFKVKYCHIPGHAKFGLVSCSGCCAWKSFGNLTPPKPNPWYWAPSREAVGPICIAFGMSQLGIEPTTAQSQGGQSTTRLLSWLTQRTSCCQFHPCWKIHVPSIKVPQRSFKHPAGLNQNASSRMNSENLSLCLSVKTWSAQEQESLCSARQTQSVWTKGWVFYNQTIV